VAHNLREQTLERLPLPFKEGIPELHLKDEALKVIHAMAVSRWK